MNDASCPFNQLSFALCYECIDSKILKYKKYKEIYREIVLEAQGDKK